MAIRTYDPKNVIVTLINAAGVSHVVGGFADGVGVKVSRKNDMWDLSTGMDGDTSRVKKNDKSGEMTITLAQTSPSNDFLSAMAENDTVDGDLATVNITDAVTGSVYTSVSAWVRKHADTEYGKEISNREWILDCVDMTMSSKGNAE